MTSTAQIRAIGFAILIILSFFWLHSVIFSSLYQDNNVEGKIIGYHHEEIIKVQEKHLADGCWNIYLDLGSNIGVQVRKLYQPELYPNAKAIPIFDKYYGEDRNSHNAPPTCSFGWEPNPRHTERLKELESVYNAKGWKTHFFTERAVSVGEKNITIYISDVKNGWGVSFVKSIDDGKNRTVQIQGFDITKFILSLDNRRLPVPPEGVKWPAPVIGMKMDIEGSEYLIIPRMITSGALCKIKFGFFEWHDRNLDLIQGSLGKSFHREYVELHKTYVRKMREIDPLCGFISINVDDETYLSDGKPLPS